MSNLKQKVVNWIVKTYLIHEENKTLKKLEKELKLAEKNVQDCKQKILIQELQIKKIKEAFDKESE